MAENKHDKKQNRIIAGSLKNVGAVFDDTAWKAIHIATNSGYDPQSGEPFSFSRIDTRKKAEKMLKQFVSRLQGVVLTGNNVSWSNANDKNDALITTLASGKKIPKELLMQWQQHNLHALTEFNARTENGMNLSDRIWEVGKQYRSELELALSLGIGEGKSADVLSRDVRQYLQHPNMLFRRVRDADHNLQLSKPAQAYHPGRGVYRSSYKNALRLTATENNMAYRTADYTRWQQMNFVLGIQIKTSPNNHPVSDICDTLQGRYPKEFKFRGWHPWCRCIAVPILPNEKAFFNGLEGDLKGEGLPYGDPITSPPKRFSKWIKANTKRIKDAKNIPYWIQDNFIDGDIEKGLKLNLNYFNGEMYSMMLNKTPLNIKDSKIITDKELETVILSIVNNNPLIQKNWQLSRVFIVKDNSNNYMKTKIVSTKKKHVYIRNKDFVLKDGNIFNPYTELKNAFIAIKNQKKLSLMQEYALETLWHELLHVQAIGWAKPLKYNYTKNLFAEMFNEYYARHTYHKLIRSIGGRSRWQKEIIKKGIGYQTSVSNLDFFLTDIGLDNRKTLNNFSDILLNKPYENIRDELCAFISNNSNFTIKEATEITEYLLDAKSEFMQNYSRVRILAKDR